MTHKPDENSLEALLSIQEVADYLGVTRGALATMRYEGRGPRYVKVSAKQVRYDRADLLTWVDEQKHGGTS